MIVAAFGEPMPKLIIVSPASLLAARIGRLYRELESMWMTHFVQYDDRSQAALLDGVGAARGLRAGIAGAARKQRQRREADR